MKNPRKHWNCIKRIFCCLPKGLVVMLFVLVGSRVVWAQASDNATLNVMLSDVRSITVNPSQTTVILEFSTPEDYQYGVTSNQTAHLIVTSTGGFQITVKASLGSLVNGAYTIPINTIRLNAEANAGTNMPQGMVYLNLDLSAVPQQIIQSPNGCVNCVFDVVYHAEGGDAYIGRPAGTYVATITYSIEPA
jgi:hypothetical protein